MISILPEDGRVSATACVFKPIQDASAVDLTEVKRNSDMTVTVSLRTI